MDAKPEEYVAALGTTFVSALVDRSEGAALRIGKDVWSKHQIATDLGIVHTKACAILSMVCKKLGVASTKDLYERTSPYSFLEFAAGPTTLYVMFAAFRDRELDPHAWFHKGQEGAIVTFMALKHRELVAERRTKSAAKQRTDSARARNHRAAVKKYVSSKSA